MSTQPTRHLYTCNVCGHITRIYSTALLHERISHKGFPVIVGTPATPNTLGG